MSERKQDVAKRLSDKVQLAMRFNIYKRFFDSENYQVMNYGIGGIITGHLDSTGKFQSLLNKFHFRVTGTKKQKKAFFLSRFQEAEH